MGKKELLKALILPAVFALSVAGYFSPFYMHITPGGLSGALTAFVLICWLVLTLTLWLYTIVVIFLAYKKGSLNKIVILHCSLIWIVYVIWFGFASNGYFLTA